MYAMVIGAGDAPAELGVVVVATRASGKPATVAARTIRCLPMEPRHSSHWLHVHNSLPGPSS